MSARKWTVLLAGSEYEPGLTNDKRIPKGLTRIEKFDPVSTLF